MNFTLLSSLFFICGKKKFDFAMKWQKHLPKLKKGERQILQENLHNWKWPQRFWFLLVHNRTKLAFKDATLPHNYSIGCSFYRHMVWLWTIHLPTMFLLCKIRTKFVSGIHLKSLTISIIKYNLSINAEFFLLFYLFWTAGSLKHLFSHHWCLFIKSTVCGAYLSILVL